MGCEVKSKRPGFPFSTLQVNLNFQGEVHRDSANLGPSHETTCGRRFCRVKRPSASIRTCNQQRGFDVQICLGAVPIVFKRFIHFVAFRARV